MTVAELVEKRIKRSKRDVFIREDFRDIGSYDQVGRVLRQLCAKELLIKTGYGVYAKARRNRINNRVMLASSSGPDAVLIETLERLKVPYELCGLTAEYVEGNTTQIPAYLEVTFKRRFSRKLSIGPRQINAS